MILGSPLPSTTSDPVNQPSSKTTSIETEDIYRTLRPPRPSFRVAKAIGLYPQTNTAVVPDRQQQSVTTIGDPLSLETRGSTAGPGIHETVESSFRGNVTNVESFSTQTPPQRATENVVDRIRNSTTKKDSKITWILATNKSSGRSKYIQEARNQSSGAIRNISLEEVEDLTVLPLQEEMSKVDLMLTNRTKSTFVSTSLSAVDTASGNVAVGTFNRSDDEVEIDEEIAQPQHFATAASILEGKESTGNVLRATAKWNCKRIIARRYHVLNKKIGIVF